MKVDLNRVHRDIAETEHRRIYTSSRKYVSGMEAGKPHHGFDYVRFLPRFKNGEFDATIENATIPRERAGSGFG